MIGVDIVKISRFNDNYLDIARRFLSQRENEEMNSRNIERRPTYVASRFSAKEAYLKATSVKLNPLDIETLNDESGKPHIYYKGEEKAYISISHDDYVACFVTMKIEGEKN